MPHDCPAPEKLTFRSKAAARRYHRQSNFSGKDRLWPYQCPGGSGEHWHLTHQTPQEQAEVAARVAKANALNDVTTVKRGQIAVITERQNGEPSERAKLAIVHAAARRRKVAAPSQEKS